MPGPVSLTRRCASGPSSAVDTKAPAVACAPLADLPHILLEHALDVSAAKAGDRASSLATLAVAANDAVSVAYIVTDEERLFESVAQELPDHIEPVRLYEAYLRNFEIESGRGFL